MPKAEGKHKKVLRGDDLKPKKMWTVKVENWVEGLPAAGQFKPSVLTMNKHPPGGRPGTLVLK
jgi:hypothetical protein